MLGGLGASSEKQPFTVVKRADGERVYVCDVCGYETRYKNVVTDHVRKHTGERPFVCPYCSFRCSQKPNWRRHIRRIHVGKPYYIDDPGSLPRERAALLGAAHAARKSLQHHEFSCSMCEYTSNVPGAELVHMSMHLNDTV